MLCPSSPVAAWVVVTGWKIECALLNDLHENAAA